MKKVGSFIFLLLVMMPAFAEPEVGKHVAGNMDAMLAWF